ncbi:MAG: hypothetical protein ACAH22_00040 [Tardiphaga sp.]
MQIVEPAPYVNTDRVFGVADRAAQWAMLQKSADGIWRDHLSDGTTCQNYWWLAFDNAEFAHPSVAVLVEIVCEGVLAKALTETFQNGKFYAWRVTGDWGAPGFVHVGVQCNRTTFDVVRLQLEALGIVQHAGPMCCATHWKKRKSRRRRSA